MTEFVLLALIPLAPLLGAAYNGILGSRMQARFGKAAVHLPAILLPALSFVVTAVAFTRLLALPPEARVLYCRLWDWMPVGALDAAIAFLMDPLSLVMCFNITFVGTLIHVYSVGYMKDEPSYWRFFCYLNLFMFSMLVLVLADNFVLLFVGWEGVGLCSYLLISFWYREKKNAVAGMKAFVVNRIGDFGFVLGLLLLFWGLLGDWDTDGYREEKVPAPAVSAHEKAPRGEGAHGKANPGEAVRTSVSFRRVQERLEEPFFRQRFLEKKVAGIPLVVLIGILFFLGAMGKSAQIPLYVWLPDAMAGPTPVSALIHAATMVTAGVYLVARLHFLFALSPFVMSWVAMIGAVTAVFAATIGFFQYDIKKVLAYSTVSQLGYMFIGVGVGAYGVAIFHVMTHAFFKACLFLGSGSVILGCHHEQDMRKLGGLRKLMPVTALTYLVACCAIAGFPFFAGFFSKDEILWKAFNAGNLILPGGGRIIWGLGALGALGTSCYMFRSYYMTFTGEYRGGTSGHHDKHDAHGHDVKAKSHDAHAAAPHESPASITVVLAILGLLSCAGGFVGLPLLWHLPNYFEHWMEPVFEGSTGLLRTAGHGEAAEWTLMILAVVLAFSGWLAARWLYRDAKNPLPQRLRESKNALLQWGYDLVYHKYYVDELYQETVVRAVMTIQRSCDWWDRNVVDALVNLAGAWGRFLGRLHGETDRRVVDGAVNGTAWTVIRGGAILRLLQTGNLRAYLYGALTGATLLIFLHYILLS